MTSKYGASDTRWYLTNNSYVFGAGCYQYSGSGGLLLGGSVYGSSTIVGGPNLILNGCSGNVGIGTTAPSSKLTVNGAISNGVTTATASDNRGFITLVAGTGSHTFTQGPGVAGIWTTAPVCIIQDNTVLANIATSTITVTNTSLTITGSVGTTDTYTYICWPGN